MPNFKSVNGKWIKIEEENKTSSKPMAGEVTLELKKKINKKEVSKEEVSKEEVSKINKESKTTNKKKTTKKKAK